MGGKRRSEEEGKLQARARESATRGSTWGKERPPAGPPNAVWRAASDISDRIPCTAQVDGVGKGPAILVALRVRLLRHDHAAMLRGRILPCGGRAGLTKFHRLILGFGGHAPICLIHTPGYPVSKNATDHSADRAWIDLRTRGTLTFCRRAAIRRARQDTRRRK